jgi:hypothetical protein
LEEEGARTPASSFKGKYSTLWRARWQFGGSFELFREGDQTRLKLTHAGLETFPPLTDFAKENFSKRVDVHHRYTVAGPPGKKGVIKQ